MDSAPGPVPTLDDIRRAHEALGDAIMRTPFLPAPKLSELTGATIRVKYENQQTTNSFKDRGALNKLLSLTEDERRRGVIALSAGNHAQSVAYHARRLGIPATIVMPETTPFVKVGNTRSHGATVELAGDTLVEAEAAMKELMARHDLVLVHPFDDFHVIAGQGTVALEMLAEDDDLDALVVPIGGGGLMSGVAIAAKALKPEIELVGVEVRSYSAMWGLMHGQAVEIGGNTLAEGIAVKDVGRLTRAIISKHVSDIVRVDEEHVERAVNAYLTLQKTMAEGAGAAGLAALLAEPERFAGRKVGLILCGGNIDPRILASIMMRELARENRIVTLRLATPDRPGVLGTIAGLIGRSGGNILDVSHHRLYLELPAKGASVEITFEVRDAAHGDEIVAALQAAGFAVRRLSAIGGAMQA